VDVSVNHPPDANFISEGDFPTKKAKSKKNPPDEAKKEKHVERKQSKGAIVVAQHTDGVAIAGMKHSFPLRGVCHSVVDLSAVTSGQFTNSLMIPDVVSMERNDINAELTRLVVVMKGKNKATKQELICQAYIKDLPTRIAKAYKQPTRSASMMSSRNPQLESPFAVPDTK
jgi:hypothetical protein